MATVDLSTYKNLYVETALEFVNLMKKNLHILSQNPQAKQNIFELFRAAHSLKSQSYALQYMSTALYCKVLEDYFHEINDGKRVYKLSLNEVILDSIKKIEHSIGQINLTNTELNLAEDIAKLKKELQ